MRVVMENVMNLRNKSIPKVKIVMAKNREKKSSLNRSKKSMQMVILLTILELGKETFYHQLKQLE